MRFALMLFGMVTVWELLIWLPPFWRFRKAMAVVVVVGLSVASGMLVGAHPSVWTLLLLVLSGYRLINVLRLVENRMAADYLYHATARSSLSLLAGQLLVLSLAAVDNWWQPPAIGLWYGLAAGQLLAALIILRSTRRQIAASQPPGGRQHFSDRDLPTISVAIPARNETVDLEACLQTLVASDYPKLEILVLDDCSQDRRTPEIIRSFAHDGVRFIAGQPPAADWLAKNYAYQQLVEAASGELLLFCGVDTRFEPGSLRAMAELQLSTQAAMISVLPANLPPRKPGLEPWLVQASRYAWELALPRQWTKRPPVLSTCWLIRRQWLMQNGGFQAVKRSSSPESYFARQSLSSGSGYRFIISDVAIGLSCLKSLADQRATAVRTRYSQLHRRPEVTALMALAELTILIVPFGLAVAAAASRQWPLLAMNLISCGSLCLAYGTIVRLTYRRQVRFGYGLLPLAAAYDIGMLHYSMWQYEFNEVIWKDRNVCVPMMRTYPKLPTAD